MTAHQLGWTLLNHRGWADAAHSPVPYSVLECVRESPVGCLLRWVVRINNLPCSCARRCDGATSSLTILHLREPRLCCCYMDPSGKQPGSRPGTWTLGLAALTIRGAHGCLHLPTPIPSSWSACWKDACTLPAYLAYLLPCQLVEPRCMLGTVGPNFDSSDTDGSASTGKRGP